MIAAFLKITSEVYSEFLRGSFSKSVVPNAHVRQFLNLNSLDSLHLPKNDSASYAEPVLRNNYQTGANHGVQKCIKELLMKSLLITIGTQFRNYTL